MKRFERKIQHLNSALSLNREFDNGLDDVRFVHRSIPDLSIDEVSINTKIGELNLSSPIFINAMTGGGGERTARINRQLARVAKECQIAMAVGSQMAALKDSDEEHSYRVVREENPDGIVIANLGSEASVDQAKKAVEMIEADAIQIHLNVIQELTMPEGDRNFCGALTRIESVMKALNVPIIIKEVGFGISRETARQLFDIGVSIIDVGGTGGTNFAEIENDRRDQKLLFFNEWGIKTAASIIETSQEPTVSIISSGGLRDSIDVAKSIALGASSAAFAGKFLKTLVSKGEEALMKEIEQLEYHLKFIMTALGAKTIKDLQKAPVVISGNTYHWLHERGIETKTYSNRTING
ncbi:MAG TPA: type 2 isopentenyl-diphosphate Delta-isomerase [Bacillales bacterium]|nr:type 2 isopentenyl-diphosphate Delta-isomerase [Bacillales bacterium]